MQKRKVKIEVSHVFASKQGLKNKQYAFNKIGNVIDIIANAQLNFIRICINQKKFSGSQLLEIPESIVCCVCFLRLVVLLSDIQRFN